MLEVAAKGDQYVDDAKFCDELHQSDQGCRYRQLAGLHGPMPDQDDLCPFRYRVGDAVMEQIMAVAVDFLDRFGLITGELLSTDGQLESSSSRYKGGAYACEDCQACELSKAARQALGEQLQSGAKRLQLPCPFPEVVKQVREATPKTGHAKDPTVSLLESEEGPNGSRATADRQQVAALLGLPADAVPPVRLTWCQVRQDPQGKLWGCCPKVPSDLEAKVGHHVDTQNPSKQEAVCGYVHL